MKKFIVLICVSKIFIRIVIVAIAIDQYLLYNLSNAALNLLYHHSFFGNYSPYSILLRITVVIIVLFNVQKKLQVFIQESYFNFKSSKRFRVSAYLFLTISVLATIIKLVEMQHVSERDLLSTIIIYLLLVAIVFGFLAFSDMIKKGHHIEAENNLTI